MTPVRSRDSGITLFEILIVLTIIALAAGAAIVAVPPSTRPLDVEVAKLKVTLNTLADRAVYTGQPHALDMDSNGYRARILDNGAWINLPVIDRRLPRGLRMQAVSGLRVGEGNTWQVTFDPIGVAPTGIVRIRSFTGTVELPVTSEERAVTRAGGR